MSGVMFDRAELEALMPTDGTYLFIGNEFIKQSAQRGYEIGYDEMAETHVQRPQAFVEDGARVGRWTDGSRVVFDRVMYVDAPQGIAVSIGHEFNQDAIWDWAAGEGITINESTL